MEMSGLLVEGRPYSIKGAVENIRKAHRAFFHYGSIGVFQGDICPLSSRAVLESCVMPVLLYGAENWIMTDGLLDKLEAFQGELVKRVLKCSDYWFGCPNNEMH